MAGDPRRPDVASAEDKVQVVLLNVARHLANYQPHPDGLGMQPWVLRIAKNVQHDAARGEKRRRHAFGCQRVDAEELPNHEACPERRIRARVLLRKVVAAIATMPTQSRTVLVLVIFGRLDHEQIASELAITVPAVKMRLKRARDYLREKFGSLDDYLSFLAPIPVEGNDPSRHWGYRVLRVSGQFVHLWPTLLTGALALSRIDDPAMPRVAEDIAESWNRSSSSIHTSNAADIEQHDVQVPQAAAHVATPPPRRTQPVIKPKGAAVTAPKPNPRIVVDDADHFCGGGSATPGSSP